MERSGVVIAPERTEIDGNSSCRSNVRAAAKLQPLGGTTSHLSPSKQHIANWAATGSSSQLRWRAAECQIAGDVVLGREAWRADHDVHAALKLDVSAERPSSKEPWMLWYSKGHAGDSVAHGNADAAKAIILRSDGADDIARLPRSPAGFAACRLADDFEHAVKAFHLAFRLALALCESGLEVRRLRCLGHLGQRLQNLVLGEIISCSVSWKRSNGTMLPVGTREFTFQGR